MSHHQVVSYLRNIHLEDLLPAVPEFRQQLANFSKYDHPNFPVFVCTVFIVVLGVVVIALRFICMRVEAGAKAKSAVTASEVDSKSESPIQAVKNEAPKPKPRWKKPVVEPKESSKKITGLKSKAERESVEISKAEQPKREGKLYSVQKKEPEKKCEKKGWFWNKAGGENTSADDTKVNNATVDTTKKKDITAKVDSNTAGKKVETVTSKKPEEPTQKKVDSHASTKVDNLDNKKDEIVGTCDSSATEEKKGWFWNKSKEDSSVKSEPEKNIESEEKKGWFGNKNKLQQKSNDSLNKSNVSEKDISTKHNIESATKESNVQKKDTEGDDQTHVPDNGKDTSNGMKNHTEGEDKMRDKVALSTKTMKLDDDTSMDKSARSREEIRKAKEAEIELLKTMGKEFRELVKLDEAGAEAKEEKRQEMEKVRSARTFFKIADQMSSTDTTSTRPANKFKLEDETLEGTGLSVGDLNLVKRRSNFYQGNDGGGVRLSQFEPGKLNKAFTNAFENSSDDQQERNRAPRKKLITLDQVMKKDSPEMVNERMIREREIEELREARKNWVPPDDTVVTQPNKINLATECPREPIANRWLTVQSTQPERPKSAEVFGKVNISTVFQGQAEEQTTSKQEIEKELSSIRDTRPTPVTKRWKHAKKETPPVRSRSAHVLQRARLPDSSWVLEKNQSVEEEKRKTVMELEMVARAREEYEAENIYDFTSIRADERRKEALQELEAVRKMRKNKQDETDSEAKVDERALRKRELENLIQMRASGKEDYVESTPMATLAKPQITQPMKQQQPTTIPSHQKQPVVQQTKSESIKTTFSSAIVNKLKPDKQSEPKVKFKETVEKPNASSKDTEKEVASVDAKQKKAEAKAATSSSKKVVATKAEKSSENSSSHIFSAKKVFKAMSSKTAEKSTEVKVKRSSSADAKKTSKDASKSTKVVKSNSSEMKKAVSKVVKSNSADGKDDTKPVEVKASKLTASDVKKTSKITKSNSSSSQVKPIVGNAKNKDNTVKPKEETSPIYSTVNKMKKEEVQAKSDAVEVNKKITIRAQESPAKSELNKINFDDLDGYKIEKCDLRMSSSLKVLPSRVINCTPRPFSRAGEDMREENNKTPIHIYEVASEVTSPMPSFYSTKIKSPTTLMQGSTEKNPFLTSSPFSVEQNNVSNCNEIVEILTGTDTKGEKETPNDDDTMKVETESMAENKLTKFFKSVTKKEDINEIVNETVKDDKDPTTPKTEAENPFSKLAKSVNLSIKTDVFNKDTKSEEVKETTTIEHTSTESKVENKISKMIKTVPFAKKDMKEEKEVNETEKEKEQQKEKQTSGAMSMKQLTEFLSLKHEPEVKNEEVDIAIDDHENTTQAAPTEQVIDKAVDKNNTEEEVDSKKDSDSQKRESRLAVKFKELKEKTVTEVNKITRGRSIQRGQPIRRDPDADSITNTRTRSESRSQKAGRMMKDFTTNILKKR